MLERSRGMLLTLPLLTAAELKIQRERRLGYGLSSLLGIGVIQGQTGTPVPLILTG